jgi:hypothetical protein
LSKVQRNTETKETTTKHLEKNDISKKLKLKRRYEDVTSGNKKNKENERKETINDIKVEASSCKEVIDDRCGSGSDSGRFTIDAAKYGNMARFINHSCSPNFFARNVLYVYDDDDLRIPHILLYAAMDIPKMNELTYNYNYKINQVTDSNGKVWKKECYYGAFECIRRLY